MTRKNRNPKGPADVSDSTLLPQDRRCFEGEPLARLLKLIKREIESARLTDASLPEKFWLKQQFSVGVNDVTRVLERMASVPDMENSLDCSPGNCSDGKPPLVQLQAILLANDCNPRWLTKHLPSLASSRKVPLIFVKDKKAGSLRLGELVKLKTAMAIGVKAKGTSINILIEEILRGDITDFETSDLKYGTSERQWVEAQVENAKQQAVLMALKSQVTSDEAHIHLDLHSLRRKHSELVGEISNLYSREEKLLSEVIMI